VLDNADKSGTGANIVLRDFKIDGSRTTIGYTPLKDAIYFSYAQQCIIENLLIINCKNDGIIIEYGSNNIVKNCIVSNCTKQGIYLSGTEYCTVVGNNAYANLVGGIAIAASWTCVISGNNCNQNTDGQFFIGRDSRYCEVTGNFFGAIGSPVNEYSIFVAAETISAGTLHGVVYPGGDTLYGITSCNFTGNTLLGKTLFVLANNNSFVGNRLVLSNSQGLVVLGSQYNTIKDNRITDWGVGFPGLQIAPATSGDNIPASMSPPIASINNTVMDNDIYDSTGTKAPTSIVGAGSVVFGNRLNGSTTDNFYEFGAWTPVLYGDSVAGTNTYAAQTGYYVRIGKNVFAQGDVQLSAKDGAMAGNVRIGALPITSASVGVSAVCVSEFVADLTAGYSIAGANIPSGQTYIALTQSGDNAALANLQASNITASSRFTFSVSYTV
jgi:parallel beta-helix repeat protein